MREKHKKVCEVLNFIEPLLILISDVTEWVSTFPFASLVGVTIGITSSYCLKCRKNEESKNPSAAKTNKGKLMLLSICAMCDNKNLRFVKGQVDW